MRGRIRSSCLVSSVRAYPEEAQSLGVRALCDFFICFCMKTLFFQNFPRIKSITSPALKSSPPTLNIPQFPIPFQTRHFTEQKCFVSYTRKATVLYEYFSWFFLANPSGVKTGAKERTVLSLGYGLAPKARDPGILFLMVTPDSMFDEAIIRECQETINTT